MLCCDNSMVRCDVITLQPTFEKATKMSKKQEDRIVRSIDTGVNSPCSLSFQEYNQLPKETLNSAGQHGVTILIHISSST
jgi:hypothetical protein